MNNHAISSAQIGEAMERSAAALVAAGNDINESLGLITAGNEIQQDAESVANALKVVSLRVRGSKTDLQEMGEDTEGLASSTSKLREELKALTGVDIMKNDNTYKSTYEIMRDISKVFDQLTDVSQANVLEKLAGKTRSSVVAGLLKNMETAEKVVVDAQNAEGSALKENERYMESIEGRLSVLTTKSQEFWKSFLNEDTVKGVVDLGTAFLNLGTNASKFFDALPGSGDLNVLSALIGGILSLRGTGGDKTLSLYRIYAGDIRPL